MKAGIIGTGPHAATRAAAIRATGGVALAEHLPEATAAGVIQRREAALDVVFVSGTAGRRVEVAEAALRQGRHVFLEWPPAASVHELERLAERAEEAGTEVGVSRPLRFHPLFDALPAAAHVSAVSVQQEVARRSAGHDDAEEAGNAALGFRARLADALDLCGALVTRGSTNGGAGGTVEHLDAQATHATDTARFETVLAGLRFASGAYTQLGLRRSLGEGKPRRRLHAAGPAFQLGADLDALGVRLHSHECGDQAACSPEEAASTDDGSFSEALLRRETRAFLRALRAGRPAPVSLLDALAVMRLAERLMRQLR